MCYRSFKVLCETNNKFNLNCCFLIVNRTTLLELACCFCLIDFFFVEQRFFVSNSFTYFLFVVLHHLKKVSSVVNSIGNSYKLKITDTKIKLTLNWRVKNFEVILNNFPIVRSKLFLR